MSEGGQNPTERVKLTRSGRILLPGVHPSASSAHSFWFGLTLALLATVASVMAAVAISHEQSRRAQLAAMSEGLELLRVEWDVSVVAARFVTGVTMHRYAGGLEAEIETAREEFRQSLLDADRYLSSVTPSEAWDPIHTDMSTAVAGALASFDEERTPADLVAWTDEFLFDFKRVVPTDNLGEWTALLEIATWAPESALVPRDYLDQAIARSWRRTGRMPADPSLVDDLYFSLAFLRHIQRSHGEEASSFTPFEEYLEVEYAEKAGPALAALVGALKGHPAVRQIEADMPYLLGVSDERSFGSVEELWPQIHPFIRGIGMQAEGIRLHALQRMDEAVRASAQRRAKVFAAFGVAMVLAIFLWASLIRRRWQIERELRRVAERDVLTGLKNRYALFAEAPGLLADPACRPAALIHLDMDDFKSINDAYGHHVGDAALVSFADTCRSCIRRQDDIVARLGGDEFVILLVRLEDPEAEAREVIDRIRKRLELPTVLQGRKLVLPASAGFAIAREPIELEDLLVEADLALLGAKERGRQTQLFNPTHRRTLFRELETAMEKRELRCAFQPQLDLRTNSIVGVEALLRWRRKDHKDLDALKLIEAIVWLGQSQRWLRMAVEDVEQAWRSVGDQFLGRLWINFAACDLMDTSADELIEILGGTDTPLDRLGIELTEPVLRPDLAAAVEKLRALREAGIAVALDDIGDNRVPILHMTELPIDMVKLDTALIAGLDTQPALVHVVESLARLCDKLSLRVVAEGVETATEEALLRRAGVHEVQGFRYGRPMPLEALEAMFAEIAARRGRSA
jgi:diguanylate cyclase (GGDEF)-like protein